MLAVQLSLSRQAKDAGNWRLPGSLLEIGYLADTWVAVAHSGIYMEGSLGALIK